MKPSNQSLPDHLRTGNWYCDLHHSMLIILAKRLKTACLQDRVISADYFIDNLTLYWVLHCLMEEDAIAQAVDRGLADTAVAAAHGKAHEVILRFWLDRVFMPFKGSAAPATLIYPVEVFYDRVLQHITDEDQGMYGTHSEISSADHQTIVARLAEGRLPLSPYMTGAVELLNRLEPRACGLLNVRSLAPSSKEPLRDATLTTALAETASCLGLRSRLRGMRPEQPMMAA